MTNQTIGSALRVETTLFERVPGFESFLDFPSALFILLVGLLLVKDLKVKGSRVGELHSKRREADPF